MGTAAYIALRENITRVACMITSMNCSKRFCAMQAENLFQRFNVLSLPGVKCDRVVIDRLKTHGADIVKLFEIRMYE